MVIIPIRYQQFEAGPWHYAEVTPDQWLAAFERGRLGSLRIVSIGCRRSHLIHDFILRRYHINPWRVHGTLSTALATVLPELCSPNQSRGGETDGIVCWPN